MVTYLAIAFILILLAAIIYGFGFVFRKPPSKEDLHTAVCVLCGQRYPRSQLAERQVGDSRILFFCASCIRKLAEDARSFAPPTS